MSSDVCEGNHWGYSQSWKMAHLWYCKFASYFLRYNIFNSRYSQLWKTGFTEIITNLQDTKYQFTRHTPTSDIAHVDEKLDEICRDHWPTDNRSADEQDLCDNFKNEILSPKIYSKLDNPCSPIDGIFLTSFTHVVRKVTESSKTPPFLSTEYRVQDDECSSQFPEWSHWSITTECSQTCGPGTRAKTRDCMFNGESDNSLITDEGCGCVGERTGAEDCNPLCNEVL